MRIAAVRVIFLLFVGLLAGSCVSPSCVARAFVEPPPNPRQFATITVYSNPIEFPKSRYSMGLILWGQFERGATISIDSAGRLNVMDGGYWPRHCATISEEELSELSREVQPVLDQLFRLPTVFQALVNPYRGSDDWRPDGPILDISFAAFGKQAEVFWDGRSRLTPEIEIAVMRTLEVACVNNGVARKYLVRNLPPEVSRRLECR